MSKQETIGNVYHDKSGYASKKTTLEDSKKKDPTIKMADVEEFFKENVEIKRKPRGQNSFYFKKGFESETKIQGWISMY